jgi:hypothetical protein
MCPFFPTMREIVLDTETSGLEACVTVQTFGVRLITENGRGDPPDLHWPRRIPHGG